MGLETSVELLTQTQPSFRGSELPSPSTMSAGAEQMRIEFAGSQTGLRSSLSCGIEDSGVWEQTKSGEQMERDKRKNWGSCKNWEEYRKREEWSVHVGHPPKTYLTRFCPLLWKKKKEKVRYSRPNLQASDFGSVSRYQNNLLSLHGDP